MMSILICPVGKNTFLGISVVYDLFGGGDFDHILSRQNNKKILEARAQNIHDIILTSEIKQMRRRQWLKESYYNLQSSQTA